MSKEASKKCPPSLPQRSNAGVNQNYSSDEDPTEMKKKVVESYAEYQFRQFWYTMYPDESRVSDPVVKEFIHHIWLAIYLSPLRSKLLKGAD